MELLDRARALLRDTLWPAEELEKRRAVGAAVSAYEEALRVHGKNSPEAKAAQRDLDRVLHQALE